MYHLRHRRRRHNRGYASAGDASGTETEGVNNVENPRTRIRGYHPVNPEVPYDPTAQWVDSTQNIPGATRERFVVVLRRLKFIFYKVVKATIHCRIYLLFFCPLDKEDLTKTSGHDRGRKIFINPSQICKFCFTKNYAITDHLLVASIGQINQCRVHS